VDLSAIEVKFKGRLRNGLSVELCKDSRVVEKNKKILTDTAGILKWELNAW
jgi:hypothetical protein